MFAYIAAILFGVAVLVSAAYSPLKPIESMVTKGRLEAFAVSHLIYHQVLTRYATDHPAVTGTVADAALGLPAWFVNPGLTHSITASGMARSWIPPSAEILNEAKWIAAELTNRQSGAITVGIVQASGYFNPSTGFIANAASVAGIPIGAVVMMTKVR